MSGAQQRSRSLPARTSPRTARSPDSDRAVLSARRPERPAHVPVPRGDRPGYGRLSLGEARLRRSQQRWGVAREPRRSASSTRSAAGAVVSATPSPSPSRPGAASSPLPPRTPSKSPRRIRPSSRPPADFSPDSDLISTAEALEAKVSRGRRQLAGSESASLPPPDHILQPDGTWAAPAPSSPAVPPTPPTSPAAPSTGADRTSPVGQPTSRAVPASPARPPGRGTRSPSSGPAGLPDAVSISKVAGLQGVYTRDGSKYRREGGGGVLWKSPRRQRWVLCSGDEPGATRSGGREFVASSLLGQWTRSRLDLPGPMPLVQRWAPPPPSPEAAVPPPVDGPQVPFISPPRDRRPRYAHWLLWSPQRGRSAPTDAPASPPVAPASPPKAKTAKPVKAERPPPTAVRAAPPSSPRPVPRQPRGPALRRCVSRCIRAAVWGSLFLLALCALWWCYTEWPVIELPDTLPAAAAAPPDPPPAAEPAAVPAPTTDSAESGEWELPICVPSRSTMLTALRILATGDAGRPEPPPPEPSSLPPWLPSWPF
eukprot:TRINITY_DN8460_c1_g4_i1.p1 TRINITY_DN8460_c1_g4~~TRINITY_DN8460_c1_g4_i1.p1  ORF type:complete len:556 (+),score=66.24 TRINITY_DN8460_c1_g4_i1:49-1668(+)